MKEKIVGFHYAKRERACILNDIIGVRGRTFNSERASSKHSNRDKETKTQL